MRNESHVATPGVPCKMERDTRHTAQSHFGDGDSGMRRVSAKYPGECGNEGIHIGICV